jgi:Domain of unknown function (DUF4272)
VSPRKAILDLLARSGFRPPDPLPEPRRAPDLRPLPDIAARLLALDTLFDWASFNGAGVHGRTIRRYGEENGVAAWLTGSEIEMWELPRKEARRQHVDYVGWRLENMWVLAWILGFEWPPGFDGRMITSREISELVRGYLPLPRPTVEELLAGAKPRARREVAAMEDLFLCVREAVRADAVPPEFDRRLGVTVLRERHQALAWSLSPGVDWDEVGIKP